ncbi:MAG TPA: Hsp20/alpha crystallin family protein [Polyangia bacterium]|nr:Hsp20/alpha crystallin family protein [Polyangia bacterium]
MWDPFESMRETMRDLFRWDPFQEMSVMPSLVERAFVPAFDVKELADSYLFRADLPGVRDEDLDISVTGTRVTVSGKREEEEARDDERYYCYERATGTFTRSFTLPEGADTDNINADLRNGVLYLTIPKKPEVQPKKISIKARASQEKEKAKA